MPEEFKSPIILNEQKIFRCILQNPTLLYDLNPDWFSCSASRELFYTIQYLYESDIALTKENISIKSNEPAYMDAPDEIFPVDYSISEWEFYVKSMKIAFVKEDISKQVLDPLKIKSFSKDELSIDDLVNLNRKLSEDIDLIKGGNESLETITQIGQRYRRALIDRKLGNAYPYGDYLIDRLVPSGAAPGKMTTIFGSTGMGKSAFNLNLFSKQINKRIPCMYITLEMDEITTMDRLIALRQRIPLKYLMMRNEGSIDEIMNADDVMAICDKELENLKKYEDRFFIVDEPALSLDDVERLITDAKKRMGVDYLICSIDLWTMIHGVGAKATDIEEAVNKTNEIAKRQNVHIINIVQANRSTDSKTVSSIEALDSLRPRSINMIKNSGAIAERSRVVFSVFRKKHYAQEFFPNDPQVEYMDDIFEVSLLKSSDSKVGGIVKYLYEGECFRLLPFVEDSDEI